MTDSRSLVIVLGMHRSGTSFLCQILEQMGLEFPGNLMPANEIDNPLGYFESRDVAEINNQFLQSVGSSWATIGRVHDSIFETEHASEAREKIADFLEAYSGHQSLVLKDPRLCMVLPLWLPLLKTNFDHVRVISILRHPMAVAGSLAKRSENAELAPAGIDDHYHSLSLWLRYNLELLTLGKELPQLLFSYESLVASPQYYANQISEFAGIDSKVVSNQLSLDIDEVEAGIRNIGSKSVLGPREQNFYFRFYELINRDVLTKSDIEFFKKYLGMNLLPESKDSYLRAAKLRSCDLRKGELNEFIAKTEGRLNRCVWSNILCPSEMDVLFVSHDAESRGHIYRVKNICDALSKLGVNAYWVEADDLTHLKHVLQNVGNIIIFRCEISEQLTENIEHFRSSGSKIAYDIDDLLFDPSAVERGEIDFISELKNDERDRWLERIAQYRNAMMQSDVLVFPTLNLSEQSKNLGKPSLVFPNSFGPSFVRVCELALATRRKIADLKITIGYASGSPTHEKDFDTVRQTLLDLMSKYENLHLKVVGCLKCLSDVEFDQFRKRILLTPIVQHTALPFEMVDFDINIIPLERNRFTDAKSELKFFEAALLNVPSVAVSNPVYEGVVRHGQNGFLAEDKNGWHESLSLLINDALLRQQIGASARRTAIALYDVEKIAVNYRDILLTRD